MFNAILGRDVPVIQAVLLVFAVVFVLANLTTDLITAALNPRLRDEGPGGTGRVSAEAAKKRRAPAGGAAEEELQPIKRHRSGFQLALLAMSKDKLALAGTVVVLITLFVTVAAPLISPYDPNEADKAVGRLAPPFTPGHLLGTDGQGRDILSRIIWGGRVSLPIAIIPILASSVLGLVVGLAAGWIVGPVRAVIMRSLDVIFAFPGVLLAVAVAAILGPGMMNAMLAMSIVVLPYVARIVYIDTVNLRESAFVEAARISGVGTLRIILGEILPNVLSPVIVYGTTSLGALVVFAAGLSFLGVGVQPPTAGLGHHGVGRARRADLGALGLAHPRSRHRRRRRGPQLHGRRAARCARPAAADAALIRAGRGGSSPMSDDGKVLSVTGLTTHFFVSGGVVKAVDGVDLEVGSREIVAIVGESGSGKSVTALSIMRLVAEPGRILAGRVLHRGRDLLALRERDMQAVRGNSISMVFQNPHSALHPMIRIGRQLVETVALRGGLSPERARSESIALLERIGVAGAEAVLDRYPHEVSAGVSQRVVLAMALAPHPALLIADEPTTNLDALAQKQFLLTVKRMREEMDMSVAHHHPRLRRGLDDGGPGGGDVRGQADGVRHRGRGAARAPAPLYLGAPRLGAGARKREGPAACADTGRGAGRHAPAARLQLPAALRPRDRCLLRGTAQRRRGLGPHRPVLASPGALSRWSTRHR